MDRYYFMEQSVRRADKVLILVDARYGSKADDRAGGVGAETYNIAKDVYEDPKQEKFLPVVRDSFDSLPDYLKSRYAIDCTPGHRKKGFEEILEFVFDKHEKKPDFGTMPRRLEQPILDSRLDMFAEMDDLLEPRADRIPTVDNEMPVSEFDDDAAREQFFREVFESEAKQSEKSAQQELDDIFNMIQAERIVPAEDMKKKEGTL